MNTPAPSPVPTQPAHSWIDDRHCSRSNGLFALGVVLLVCGAAITGRHEVTMIGLGLIIFSSIFEW